VLNAFRHHRVSRLEQAARKQANIQVLNAFRHHRVSRPIRGRPRVRRECAQRLSASQSFAGRMCSRAGQALDVLNAFRHHRVSRISIPKGNYILRSVLNAFRHHRVSRAKRIWRPRRITRCSTPFGITEFRGSETGLLFAGLPSAQRLSASQSFAGDYKLIWRKPVDPVLNAFRHHRVSRHHE